MNTLHPVMQAAIAPWAPPPAVDRFISCASAHPEEEFFVTRVGCGLAGHLDQDIAPMFREASENCSMPDTWAKYLKEAQ